MTASRSNPAIEATADLVQNAVSTLHTGLRELHALGAVGPDTVRTILQEVRDGVRRRVEELRDEQDDSASLDTLIGELAARQTSGTTADDDRGFFPLSSTATDEGTI
jgi:hypothetical protein